MNTESGTTNTPRGHQTADHRDEGRDRESQEGPDVRGRSEEAPDRTHDDRTEPVLGSADRDDYRDRWDHLQAQFVDDPRGTTQAADDLLRETFDDVTTRWRERHDRIRGDRDGSDVSTEELRTTLRRYRDEFERLLGF